MLRKQGNKFRDEQGGTAIGKEKDMGDWHKLTYEFICHRMW
jgi:hypothetical protein